jgi:NDP-sugar pyrophosphorylase family protein
VLQTFRSSGLPALMVVLHNRGSWDRSNAVVAGHLVASYDKRSPAPGAEWIDYGLLALRAECIRGEGPADLSDVQRRLAAAGKLGAYEVHDRFYEIGTAAALAEAERFLAAPADGSSV